MFTRDIYQDYIRYDKPGKYQLLPESTHRGAETCFQEIPEMHANNGQYKISSPNDMANIESDLYNLIRPNSKDPTKKYPFVRKDYNNPPGPLQVCGPDNDFRINYPKLEGSQFNREKSIHIPRFESLCLNPQQSNRIRSNNVIGLNTRLYNRDTHKPHIPILSNHTNIFMSYESFGNTKKKKNKSKSMGSNTIKYYQKQNAKSMNNMNNMSNKPYNKYNQSMSKDMSMGTSKEPFCGGCAGMAVM